MTGDPMLPVNHPGHPAEHEHLVFAEVPAPLDGTAPPGVQTLRSVRDTYGNQGVMKSPRNGRTALFSLERWHGRDPDSTFLRVSFSHVDPTMVGKVLPVAERHKLKRMEPPISRVEFDFE